MNVLHHFCEDTTSKCDFYRSDVLKLFISSEYSSKFLSISHNWSQTVMSCFIFSSSGYLIPFFDVSEFLKPVRCTLIPSCNSVVFNAQGCFS
jgi:hypothetical protein